MNGLHELVARAARRSPEAPAVHHGDRTATYRELDVLADRFASALLDKGIGVGDRVVLWAEKSVEAVALTQAVLRLGAIYSPVAPSNPRARVERIAAGCGAATVVTEDTFADLLAAAPEGARVRPHTSALDDPAYILYTSGSTGQPKGVTISHRNALTFVEWAAAETDLRPGDRLANHAPFNFDLSVFDLYGAFYAGASVDLAPYQSAYAPAELVEFLCGRGITVWYSVPSALQLMMRQGELLDREPPAALRICAFAGEPFPVDGVSALRRAWPHVRMFNWYGPTETNVCTSYEVSEADIGRHTPLPIGAACAGNRVYLDADGEIMVDGPTVMLGYWGADPHRGPYRTGDLGRLTESGLLEYAGRRDAMVKVRGHRVEPGDVEAALSTHPAVAEVAVLVVGAGLDTRLHAVATARPGQRPTLLGLKRHCAELLPHYLIIDTLAVVDDLPRTANGKTDREALRRTESPQGLDILL